MILKFQHNTLKFVVEMWQNVKELKGYDQFPKALSNISNEEWDLIPRHMANAKQPLKDVDFQWANLT